MEDFEEKLNTILSSPETMGQIMALANSISGKPEGGTPAQEGPVQPQETPAQPPQGGAAQQTGDMLSLLQGLDPSMLTKLAALYREYARGEDEKAALLTAMRPFLRPERQEKVEKALQITRISRVIQAAFGLFREEHHV
ncbi:MAG: hypothetical protein LIO78_03935 [Clostridiales bacterium]|nr:hypothetical protein [Clostridiales bacterium]MCC8099202.1 hypothetical protein [Clostridiales bacterium]